MNERLPLTKYHQIYLVLREQLQEGRFAEGLPAETASSIEDALRRAAQKGENARVLIGGSLYLAGRVLALHSGEKPSEVTGAARR